MHMIEHTLRVLYDIAHGAGLVIIIPKWMKYVLKECINSVSQRYSNLEKFAKKVCNSSPVDAILQYEN